MTTARGGLHDAPAPIGVVKQYSARREPIEVRRLRLRMPAEAADPVVEVVHREKQDVGPLVTGRQRRTKETAPGDHAGLPVGGRRLGP